VGTLLIEPGSPRENGYEASFNGKLRDLIHALYPEYAKIASDFAKHYSRDQKTGAIKYNPHIK
jgi:hypothetical protein